VPLSSPAKETKTPHAGPKRNMHIWGGNSSPVADQEDAASIRCVRLVKYQSQNRYQGVPSRM
jgi:hypothetical protein